MGSAIILFSIISAALICIRAGAIALELTGMEREKARFQALSAFTNTGFTTREAEEVTRIPLRRKIVTVLIVLGYAGTVTVIASFATSLLQRQLASLVMTAAIFAALYILYRIASWRGLTKRFTSAFRRVLIRRYGLSMSSLEAMLRVGEGFGVVRATVKNDSPLIGRPLSELDLKGRKVQILSIIRGADTITIPQGSDVLLKGDVLVCYGSIEAVERLFFAVLSHSLVPDDEPPPV
ncbi:MAG: TrkA C-terminal domain-containing protein [Candidatus Krumholzibacteria bacterium]|nr:TrkA C-terminal domain-containing protein [Candidatus Krumholzibacteria bacterium]